MALGNNRGKPPVAQPQRDVKRTALRTCPLFQAMLPDELDAILAFSIERRIRRGQMIVQKGDAGTSMMAVLSGRVRISAVNAEGREITLNVINPGQVFGEIALLDGQPRSADASAIEDTLLLVVERRHFMPFLASNQNLTSRLLAVLCERLRSTSLALEQIALFDLEARLARLILKLAADYGKPSADGTRIEMKLSQRDISNLVAASRESVNKQLGHWRDSGVLAFEGGYIVVRRSADLQALVEPG
ncbi:MAG TPA: Crp/Fnr family transcriptional regulator [Acetobacteraceae bacterium]|nr:Crp/Fnr family transcriptional regulator [Acetobacteraceae bacterium]